MSTTLFQNYDQNAAECNQPCLCCVSMVSTGERELQRLCSGIPGCPTSDSQDTTREPRGMGAGSGSLHPVTRAMGGRDQMRSAPKLLDHCTAKSVSCTPQAVGRFPLRASLLPCAAGRQSVIYGANLPAAEAHSSYISALWSTGPSNTFWCDHSQVQRVDKA